MFLLKKLLTALLLPPAGPILLGLFGLWLAGRQSRRWRRAGFTLAGLSLLGLLALSLPVVGNALMAPLQAYPPIAPAQLQRVQAIVVLGGGSYFAPEYGDDTVGLATLDRMRYGARLARDSGLPLLVSGGAPSGGRPEGELMREALERDFVIKVRWVEAASRNTAENASMSAPILKAAGVTRIALVSNAWHLPRALPLFQKEGLEVTPAPMGYSVVPQSLAAGFVPKDPGTSRDALHEYLGLLFNRFKETP